MRRLQLVNLTVSREVTLVPGINTTYVPKSRSNHNVFPYISSTKPVSIEADVQ